MITQLIVTFSENHLLCLNEHWSVILWDNNYYLNNHLRNQPEECHSWFHLSSFLRIVLKSSPLFYFIYLVRKFCIVTTYTVWSHLYSFVVICLSTFYVRFRVQISLLCSSFLHLITFCFHYAFSSKITLIFSRKVLVFIPWPKKERPLDWNILGHIQKLRGTFKLLWNRKFDACVHLYATLATIIKTILLTSKVGIK